MQSKLQPLVVFLKVESKTGYRCMRFVEGGSGEGRWGKQGDAGEATEWGWVHRQGSQVWGVSATEAEGHGPIGYRPGVVYICVCVCPLLCMCACVCTCIHLYAHVKIHMGLPSRPATTQGSWRPPEGQLWRVSSPAGGGPHSLHCRIPPLRSNWYPGDFRQSHTKSKKRRTICRDFVKEIPFQWRLGMPRGYLFMKKGRFWK